MFNFERIELKEMQVQIIQDENGKATGVYIPIRKWEQLKRKYNDLEAEEYVAGNSEQLIRALKEAIHELKLVEEGKSLVRPAKEFLDEL